MLREFFHKAATEIDRVMLAWGSCGLVAASSMGGPTVPWFSALKGAAVGTLFNDHKIKEPTDGGRLRQYFSFRNLFNYHGFKTDRPRMAFAFGAGILIGGLAGEFTRATTGSYLVARLLSYCIASVISATAAPLKMREEMKITGPQAKI